MVNFGTWIAQRGNRDMADARYMEPGGAQRYAPVAPERFEPDARERARIEADRGRRLNASRRLPPPLGRLPSFVEGQQRLGASLRAGSREFLKADQEAARARQLRVARIESLKGKARLKAIAQHAALGQVEKITKYYRRFRTTLTIIGGLSSLTIIGIIWTIIQWNVQMVWTVFGLPGKDYIALSWWLVPVILFIDFLLFIIFATIMLASFFLANPRELACAVGPEVTKTMLGNGFLATLGGKLIKWSCGAVSAVTGS